MGYVYQAQIRQEMDRLAKEFKGNSIHARQGPNDHILEAKRTIQETQSYLTKQARSNTGSGRKVLPKLESNKMYGHGNGPAPAVKVGAVPDYYLVTTHLLPLSSNVIPDVLPVPLETEWSQVEEGNGGVVDENGHIDNQVQNQNNTYKGRADPAAKKSHLLASRLRR